MLILFSGIPVYILCVCCYKKGKPNKLEENMKAFASAETNGKTPVQIVIESPTPPDTINKSRSNIGGYMNEIESRDLEEIHKIEEISVKEEVIQQSAVENEEKEAKIIDLLDQVLQAEEDRYEEIIHLKDEENVSTENEPIVHRKSLGELSDAGSDASLGNQALSKYDVIAQVHREDLPIVDEEEHEQENIEIEEHEEVTAFNESDSNSRTDESGYSDTIIDRTALHDSVEDVKEDAPYIPTPPPLDENYFAQPYFKKSYTMPKPKNRPVSEEEITAPRESLQSNSSQGDGNIVFGSDRQINFMSKLSNVLQVKLNTNDDQEQRKRSHSIGNMSEDVELSVSSRPLIFEDLKKELLLGKNLRPVNVEEPSVNMKEEPEEPTVENEEADDTSMSRKDLKTKLESIFATGGPKLLKPRLMKSNPPTPEEAYQTESSSTESLPKITKGDKNDTLSRQKAKFGEVLNSFRLSFNNDDQV